MLKDVHSFSSPLPRAPSFSPFPLLRAHAPQRKDASLVATSADDALAADSWRSSGRWASGTPNYIICASLWFSECVILVLSCVWERQMFSFFSFFLGPRVVVIAFAMGDELCVDGFKACITQAAQCKESVVFNWWQSRRRRDSLDGVAFILLFPPPPKMHNTRPDAYWKRVPPRIIITSQLLHHRVHVCQHTLREGGVERWMWPDPQWAPMESARDGTHEAAWIRSQKGPVCFVWHPRYPLPLRGVFGQIV